MERFATNRNGNIDSGTEVLANNMVYLQQAKANAISNLFGDLFVEGILNTGNVDTMFKLSANNDGTFNVSAGIAYVQDVSVTPSIYERIQIIDDTEQYNYTNPFQTTPDGAGHNINTPKSTGCKNITIPNQDIEYYVDLRYLNVCDNGNNGNNLNLTNYSIAKNQVIGSTTQEKRFYKWINGYQIVLVPKPQTCQGICLGVVSKNSSNVVTITVENRAESLLIKSRVFMDYFNAGAGLIVVMENDETTLSVNVDNITIEVDNEDKVRVTKDGLYPYTKFAMNSGPSNILTYSGNEISTVNSGTPLWLNPAYIDRYSITNKALGPLNVWTQVVAQFDSQAGKYTVCINNTDKNNNNEPLTEPILELMGTIYASKFAPTTGLKAYDIWLDLSSQPYKAKWYYNNNWLEYNGVPVGLVDWVDTVTGIDENHLYQFNFNKDYTQFEAIGDFKINFGKTNPDNTKYLVCDGSPVSKFLYYDLHRKIGDIYGNPTDVSELTPAQQAIDNDPTHYFFLPDYREKTVWGGTYSDLATYIEAGLPNIKGHNALGASSYYAGLVNNDGNRSGAFSGTQTLSTGSTVAITRTDQWSIGAGTPLGVNFDASLSSSVYKDSVTVVQPAVLQTPFLIRYSI